MAQRCDQAEAAWEPLSGQSLDLAWGQAKVLDSAPPMVSRSGLSWGLLKDSLLDLVLVPSSRPPSLSFHPLGLA